MDRDEFRAALARSTAELVALAGVEHVSSYTRTSKTGKTVHVSAYTRDPGKMSNPDLFSEFKALSTGQSDLPQTQRRARLGAITTEIRKRKTAGTWNSAAKPPEPQTPNHTGGANGLDMRGANAGPNPGNNWNGKGKPEGKTPEVKYDAALKQTADAAKPDAKTTDPTADPQPEDANGWKPGAEHATSAFLDEKHHKQSGEPGGVYTPDRQEQAAWDARMAEMLNRPLDDGTIADITAGPSTADKHLERGPDGSMRFSKERQALHKKIIEAFLDGYAPQKKPRYHMMGGGPASGKSVMEKANPEISAGNAIINADEVKNMIPEAWTKDGKMDAGLAHEESSHIAKLIQREAFSRKVGVTLDGTGDGGANGVRKKLAQARENGYEVHGYYVSADTETAIQRAAQRASKPPYRAVPEPLLRKTHKDVSTTFPQVMDEFDSVKLYDSSGREGILTGEKKPGGRFEVKDAEAWKRFLDKAHQ